MSCTRREVTEHLTRRRWRLEGVETSDHGLRPASGDRIHHGTLCASDTSSFEQLDKLIQRSQRRRGDRRPMSNMTDVDFRNHFVLQPKRLATFAELRSEVAEFVRTRAATSPVFMHVGAV